MKNLKNSLQTAIYALSAAVVLVAALLPVLANTASAVAQVTSRSITMSTSAPSATNVTYTTTFTPASTTTNPDYIVDFCSNDPLVGDSCTATAGTDVPNMSSAAVSGFTVTTIGSNRGIKLTGTNTYTSGTPKTLTITGVTNPSNTGTFYARILVYANGGAGANTSASPGAYVDYGGVALSTASNISITAKVFETLSFCVFQTSCGTAPSLTLGDPTTGALSTSTAYINSNAKYTLATNAGSGVTVFMRGTTLCRPGNAGSCTTGTANAYTITSQKPSAATFSTPGSEQFGMCADVTGNTSSLAATAPYIDTANGCHSLTTGTYSGTSLFGFDDDTTSGGTNFSGGSQVLSAPGAVTSYTGGFTFAANIANTTEAGIYQTSLNMVATSTF